MTLAKRLVQTVFMWIAVMTAIVLIVLIPRDILYEMGPERMERTYTSTWEDYQHNISRYVHTIWNEKSLGVSRHNRPVTEDLKIYFGRSAYMILIGFFLAMFFGVLKGIYDYRKGKEGKNLFGHGLTWLFQSLPDFFVIMIFQTAMLLLMMKGFPHISIYGHGHWYSFILPSIFVAIYPMFYIARITSSSLASEDNQLYIVTAKAKGLSDRMILYKHVLGNCWVTILSHASSIMMYILSNLLIVEYLMFYKGAAYRLYEGFGHEINRTLSAGHQEVYEGDLIIAILVSFLLLIALAQVISQLAQHYIDQSRRDGHERE